MTHRSPVTIYCGSVGSGKTYRCMRSLYESLLTGDGLMRRHAYLVPTVEHVDRIRDMLFSDFGFHGACNQVIMTWDQFVRESSEREVSFRAESNIACRDIVRRCIEQVDLRFYAQITGHCREMFVDECRALISDIKIAETFTGNCRIQRLETESALAVKFGELYRIYRLYQDLLSCEHCYDDDDVFIALIRAISASVHPQYEMVIVDGFFDFTPRQKVLLQHMTTLAARLTITMTGGDTTAGRDLLYSPVSKTINYLRALFPSASWIACPEKKRSYSPALAWLADTVFADDPPVFASADVRDMLSLVECSTVKEEVLWIARRIKRCITIDGYRPNDICVVFRNCNPYVIDITSTFTEYGIPFSIHERRHMNHNVHVKRILGFTRIVFGVCTQADILAYLQSHAGITACDLQEIESFLHHSGATWTDLAGCRQTCLRAEAPETFRAHIERLFGYYQRIAVDRPAHEHTESLCAILRAERLIACYSDDYSAEDCEVVRRIEEIFEEVSTNMPGMVNGVQYIELFMKILDLSLYSFTARSVNAVQIYNVTNAKQKEYKVVFIAGVNDGQFPSAGSDSFLLKNDEKRRIAEQTALSLAYVDDRYERERYLFYLTMTRAVERLFLSYVCVDERGKALLPSMYLDDIRECFHPGALVPLTMSGNTIPQFNDVSTIRELMRRIGCERGKGIRDARLERIEHQYGWDLEHMQRHALSGDARGIGDARVITRCRESISGPFSATMLEEYLTCPYRFFIKRLVRVEEPREILDPRIRGAIVHKVLERFYREQCGQIPKLSWTLFTDPERANAEIARIFREEIAHAAIPQQHMPRMQGYLAILLRSLHMFIADERDSEWHRLSVPYALEHDFGRSESEQPAYEIAFAPGKTYAFQGQIDRIDHIAATGKAYIIDYKGDKELPAADIESGRVVQLLLYMDYAKNRLGKDVVGAEYRSYTYGTKKGFYIKPDAEELGISLTRKKVYSRDDFEQFFQRMRTTVLSCIEGMRAGRFPCAPEDCNYCVYTAICRYDARREILTSRFPETNEKEPA